MLLLAAGGAVATRAFAAPSAGCMGEPATITGSGIIIGTEGDDVIVGSGVSDTIDGKGGDDVVCGPGRSDVHLSGGLGDDRLHGVPATTGSAATSSSRAVAVYGRWAVATTSSTGDRAMTAWWATARATLRPAAGATVYSAATVTTT
jgi:Ca2+-binding RTX toxin-like protein